MLRRLLLPVSAWVALTAASACAQSSAQAEPNEESRPAALSDPFLSRPYTVADRALDVLKERADRWAESVDLRTDYSKDVETDPTGIQGDTGVGIDSTGTIIVSGSLGGIVRLRGAPQQACETALKMFDFYAMGMEGKNVEGQDMRVLMVQRAFGPATFHVPGAEEAARSFLEHTRVRMTILAGEPKGLYACSTDAWGRNPKFEKLR